MRIIWEQADRAPTGVRIAAMLRSHGFEFDMRHRRPHDSPCHDNEYRHPTGVTVTLSRQGLPAEPELISVDIKDDSTYGDLAGEAQLWMHGRPWPMHAILGLVTTAILQTADPVVRPADDLDEHPF